MYGNGTIAIGESVISYDNIDNYSWEYVYKHWCSYIVPLFFWDYIRGVDYEGMYNGVDWSDEDTFKKHLIQSPLGDFIYFMQGKAEKDETKRIFYSLNSFFYHIDAYKLIIEILYEWRGSMKSGLESVGHIWKYFYNPEAALAFILSGTGGDNNPTALMSLEGMTPESYYYIPSGDDALNFFRALLSELYPAWKDMYEEESWANLSGYFPEMFIKYVIKKDTNNGVDDWLSWYKENLYLNAENDQMKTNSALSYTYYVIWPFILLLLWPYFMHIFSFNYYPSATNFEADRINLQTEYDYANLGAVFWGGSKSNTVKKFQAYDCSAAEYHSKGLEDLMKHVWWFDNGWSEYGLHHVFGNDLAMQMKWPPSEYFRYFREYVPNYDYWGSLITGIPRAYSRYDTDIFNGVDQDDSNNCWQVI